MLRGVKPNDGLPEALVGALPDKSFIFNLPTLDFDDILATFKGTDGGQAIDFIAHEFAKRDLRR